MDVEVFSDLFLSLHFRHKRLAAATAQWLNFATPAVDSRFQHLVRLS
jgi:hypothetical protein